MIRIPDHATGHGHFRHNTAQIHGLSLNGNGIGGHGVFLNAVNIGIYTGRQGQNRRNADNADAAGKGGQQRPCLLGPQVVKAERQCGKKRHGGSAHVFMLRRIGFGSIHSKGIGIIGDPAVTKLDNTGSIGFRQFRIMGDHDHEPVLCHLFQKLHDLHAGFCVQCAGRLIRKKDIWIVDECPGNGHPLHLTTGHLVRLFVKLIPQPHLFQCPLCPLAPFFSLDAGNGERQLHIGKNGLVGNKVITLKHKTDGMVAVRVPIPVLVFFGGDTINDQISPVIAVQAADNIQKCGLSGAGGTQNGNKFIIPQIDRNIIQRLLDQFACFILLADICKLKHCVSSLHILKTDTLI